MDVSISKFSEISNSKDFIINGERYSRVVCCSNPNRIMFQNNGKKRYLDNIIDIKRVNGIDSDNNVSEIYIVCEDIFNGEQSTTHVKVVSRN